MANIVFVGHFLDAFASFVGIEYLNFSEQHVVPTFLYGLFGDFVFVSIVKLVIAFFAIKFILNDSKGLERNILLFLVMLLGWGPGTRNLFLVVM